MSTRDRFSVVLRLFAGPARSGRLVGHAEVVDTGEQVPISGAEDLTGLAQRLGEDRAHERRRASGRGHAMVVALLVFTVCFAGQVLTSAPAHAAACTKVWIDTDGNFNDELSWSPKGVPNGTDVACITASGNYTVLIDRHGESVAGLVLGGTSGTQELRIVSHPGFNYGLNVGEGTIGSHGVVTLTSQSGEAASTLSSSGTITNQGVIHTVAGTGQQILSGTISNEAGGLLDIDTPTQFVYNPAVLINNGGTIDLLAPLSVFAGAGIRNTGGIIRGTGFGFVSVSDSAEGFTQAAGTVTGNPARISGGAPLHVTGSGAGSFYLSGGARIDGKTVPGQTVTLRGIANGGDITAFTDGFVNGGDLIITSTSGLPTGFAPTEQGKAWTNTGTVHVIAGAGGLRSLEGVLHNKAGGRLDIDALTQYPNTSQLINEGGIVDLTQPLAFLNSAHATNYAGTINGTGNGYVVVTDSAEGFTQAFGKVTGNPVRVQGGAPLKMVGTGAGSFQLSGGARVSGRVRSNQSLLLPGITNGGDVIGYEDGFVNDGTITMTSVANINSAFAPTTSGGGWTNNGTVNLRSGAGGLRQLYGVLDNKTGGLLDVDTPSQYIGSDGALRNRGGTIDLAADLAVIGAPFSQTSASTLRVQIASSSSFGRLLTDVPVSLAGRLAANTTYTPPIGKSFAVLNFPSRTGTFATSSFTGGPTYLVKHSSTTVQLVAVPSVRINDVSATEGSTGGTKAFVFTVSSSKASAAAVTLKFATANGSAVSPSDYTAASGTVTFGPGQTAKQVKVLVRSDSAHESNETFTVELSAPTNATIQDATGRGTIRNDD